MRKILETLKAKPILKEQDILALKQRIAQLYPALPANKRAALLADSIHRIIDRNIEQFDELYRVPIRINILQRTLLNNYYDIHAGEIFMACLVLENGNVDYLHSFTDWVNAQQEVLVTQETLSNFTVKAKHHAGELLEESLEMILDRLDQVTGLEQDTSTTELNSPLSPPPSLVALPVSQSNWQFHRSLKKLFAQKNYLVATILVVCIPVILTAGYLYPLPASENNRPSNIPASSSKKLPFNALPKYLQYKEINPQLLKNFLHGKNSLLATEPYFSSIIGAAEEFNVNPLLLFAIAGHEQAFVPKSHTKARQIANNPFNVFHSWTEYNTNIGDSARIAARTVVNLSEGRPNTVDPILWINRKYAEDKNWWIGVKKIYTDLESHVNGNKVTTPNKSKGAL